MSFSRLPNHSQHRHHLAQGLKPGEHISTVERIRTVRCHGDLSRHLGLEKADADSDAVQHGHGDLLATKGQRFGQKAQRKGLLVADRALTLQLLSNFTRVFRTISKRCLPMSWYGHRKGGFRYTLVLEPRGLDRRGQHASSANLGQW